MDYTPEPSSVDADLEKRFTYHSPTPEKAKIYEELRANARGFAYKLKQVCPSGRELSLALTHLEEMVMWANAAIARN